jgi:hypothetical protein
VSRNCSPSCVTVGYRFEAKGLDFYRVQFQRGIPELRRRLSARTQRAVRRGKPMSFRLGERPREPLSVYELKNPSHTGLQKQGVNRWSLLEL